MKKRNPVIDQAEQRGYEKGLVIGREAGRAQAINFIVDWFDNLDSIPGIGPKTAEKIRTEFINRNKKR